MKLRYAPAVVLAAVIVVSAGAGYVPVAGASQPVAQAGPAAPQALYTATGKITFLRVHNVGTGWGAPPNAIDGEVIIRLNTMPNWAFGFQLRDDTNSLTHQAMLAMLRDAYRNNWDVTIDYDWAQGMVGVIVRVILAK